MGGGPATIGLSGSDLTDRAVAGGNHDQPVINLLDSRHVSHDLAGPSLLPRVGDFAAKRGQAVLELDVDLVSVEGGLLQGQRDILGDLLVLRFWAGAPELASVSFDCHGKEAAGARPGATATIPRVNTHFPYLRIECSP